MRLGVYMNNLISLSQLGWKPFFQQQISLQEWENNHPARVIAHNRSGYTLLSEQGQLQLNLTSSLPSLTVGDWVLLNAEQLFVRLLERNSLFSRKAAGSKLDRQLIAANIDTVFIVCSLNQDFNLNRIERYLSLTHEAGVDAIIVLTKLDCCENPDDYLEQLKQSNPMLLFEVLNALEPHSVAVLKPWCGGGQTIAFLGSSGVGKSTLVNTLMGNEAQATAAIRSDDAKGRHTTTNRSLHFMPDGALLLDTPGMRELQLAGCERGVKDTFSEIDGLAANCQFSDCQHQSEPGCAVKTAIQTGELEPRRLANYQKIMHEQAFNSASLAEKRAKDRNLGRFYRAVQNESRKRKKG